MVIRLFLATHVLSNVDIYYRSNVLIKLLISRISRPCVGSVWASYFAVQAPCSTMEASLAPLRRLLLLRCVGFSCFAVQASLLVGRM